MWLGVGGERNLPHAKVLDEKTGIGGS